MIFACQPLWCFPFFLLSQLSKQHVSMSHGKKTLKTAKIDFSGHWQGECNQQEVGELVIVQKSSNIILAYGGVKEKYLIDELNSISTSNNRSSELSSVSVFWNKENSALIFLHSLNFAKRDNSSSSAHFSKSSMQLEQSNLLIKTQYFSGFNTLDSIKQDTLNCVYQKKI